MVQFVNAQAAVISEMFDYLHCVLQSQSLSADRCDAWREVANSTRVSKLSPLFSPLEILVSQCIL